MKTLVLLVLSVSAIHGEIVTLAHPDEALPEKNTVVWSPLFQATWDKLNSTLGGPPDRIETPNALMTKLDSFKWDAKKIMPDGSWKTWSGPATMDFLNQVNREAAAITKEKKGPFKLMQENPANRAAFGLLDREVTFQKEFIRSRNSPLGFRVSGGEKPVSFFGARDEMIGEIQDTIRILSFRPSERSHAIQIRCKQADDTVILYLPAKPQSFATACAWLRAWRSQYKPDPKLSGAWNDPSLHRGDEIRIPYVDLESNADLTSKLAGTRIHGNKPWRIIRAEQLTRFQLHEKGARVRVEVSIEADPFADSPSSPPVIPRKFIYDRPFFVFLWRDNAEWPYFGAWIGDTSALKAFP
jgi:hypothetical protein